MPHATDDSVSRDQFEPAVRTILADFPDGLSVPELRRRINAHPAFEVEVSMQEMHPLLGELCHDDVLVSDPMTHSYRLADEDGDA